jgi:AdoMet-dependent rRNA methyltransferase SPB1
MSIVTNKKAGAKWKETRHDKYYHLAKEQGYRSRAAFKLIQINKKYNILSSCKSCLDLCAAPGGWSQVANKYMPVASMLIAVDIKPIRPIKGAVTIQSDITTAECKGLIKKELHGWDCDVILNDGAPNVAGGQAWSKDAYQQVELVIYSLRLVTNFLRQGGTFVTKVFRSQDYNALLWVLQQFFERCEVTKPAASRSASAEIFIVCLNYKKPKKIDPALLDPNVVFQSYADSTGKKIDVFKQRESAKGVRSREGYDTDKQVVYEEISADQFILAPTEEAIAMLGKYNAFTFKSEASRGYLDLKETSEEVKALISDLKVLGKGDFRQLMNWRKKIRALLDKIGAEKAENEAELAEIEPEKALTAEEQAELDEKQLNRELMEMKQKKQHERRKEKRKKRESKAKQQQKLLLNANNLQNASELLESAREEGLFSIDSVENNEILGDLDAGAAEALELSELSGEEGVKGKASSGNMKKRALAARYDEISSEEEAKNTGDYYDQLEAELDWAYEEYKKRRNQQNKAKKSSQNQEIDENQLSLAVDKDFTGENEDIPENGTKSSKKRKSSAVSSDSDSESGPDAAEIEQKHPLLTDLGGDIKPSAALRSQRWFDRDLFKGIMGENNEIEGKTAEISAENGQRKGKKNGVLGALFDSYEAGGSDSSEESEENGEFAGEEEKKAADEDSEEETARAEQQFIKNLRKDHLHGLDSLAKTPQQLEEQRRKEKKQQRIAQKNEKRAVKLQSNNSEGFSSQLDADGDAFMLVDEDSRKKAKRMERLARNRAAKELGLDEESKHGQFEEVGSNKAVEQGYSSDSDAAAAVLAMGTAMLDKKRRTEMVDNSYNRYAFDVLEVKNLPEWFQIDESTHNQAQLPISREEFGTFKAKLKAINARPIKKIAEARARKADKTAKRWEKIKQKAEAIAKEEGPSENVKMREIEKLYHKRAKTAKRERKYIVSKKGGGTAPNNKKGGGQVVRVDTRMKKDKRGTKHAEKRKSRSEKTQNKRRKKQ